MDGKMITFVSPEKIFLNNTIRLFEKLKEQLSEEEKANVVTEIKELLKRYEKNLPKYFKDILWLMKDVIQRKLFVDSEEPEIEEVLILADVMNQKPSVDVFKEMVRICYSSLSVYPYFTEEHLWQVYEELMKMQEETRNQIEKKEEDVFFIQNLQRVNYSNWIALIQMENAPEELLMKAIANAELNLYNLYSFCEAMIVAKNASENVLLALVQRIQTSSWVEKEKDYQSLFPIRLYCFLFSQGKSTEKIVKQMLKSANPRGPMYYQFFYSIIQNHKNSQEIMRKVLEILKKDEIEFGARYHVARRKLTLLIQNR